MLRRVKEALKPGGYFACQFHFDARKMRYAEIDELLRKALAFTILGNLQYEKGDFVWVDREFIHIFSSEKDLLDEFKEGGFEVRYISRDSNMSRGEALLLKA